MKAPFGIEEELPDPFIRQREQKGKAAFVTILPGGRVWGDSGTVVTKDGQLLEEVAYEFGKNPDENSFFSAKAKGPERIKGRVAVLSTAGGGYFHWMTGVMPRLHLIEKSGIKLESIDTFIIDHGGYGFQEEAIKAFGIGASRIIESNRTSYFEAEELIVPSLAWHKHHMPPWSCNVVRKTFLDTEVRRKDKRLLLSREDARERRISNSREVLKCLEEQGFEKIIPGEMTIKEQARAFSVAEVIVSPHGAGLTNILFAPPGTKVIEIFSPHYIEKCFWILASQLELEYGFILGESTPRIQEYGKREDIRVDINKLKKVLEGAYDRS